MLLIIAPLIPNAFGTFNSFFDTGLLIPAIVWLIVVGVAGIVEFLHHRRKTTRDVSTGRRAVGSPGDNSYSNRTHGCLGHSPPQ